jgi:S1-C subfamily serine protease
MTTIDWIIVTVTVVFAFWGYSQGLVVSALSLVGFAGGAFAGSRLTPLLLDQGSRSPYAPLFGLVGALFVGAVVSIVLEAVGSNIRSRLTIAPLALIDGIGGAVLIAALALGLAWIGGAVALQAPGSRDLRRQIQRSAILSRLNEVLPPSGPFLNALARADPFPRVRGPDARVPAPTRGILADRDVRRAGRSVVKIRGTACGLGVQGSGWVAGPGLVVTNAHVVAGQDDTTAALEGGPNHDAQAVAYDPHNDVAVLRVDGLDAPALRQNRRQRVGSPVAFLGFPRDGPFRATAGRLGATQTVISQDSYGSGPIRRRMTALRGAIRSGNSGGPAVDASGRVVATVFAASESRPRGGFGVPAAIVAARLARAGSPVSTGPCVR